MADDKQIKAEGPGIGERVVATVTEGVKQGVAGLVIGGAAGAALGGLAAYVADYAKDIAVTGAQCALDGAGTDQLAALAQRATEAANQLQDAAQAAGDAAHPDVESFKSIVDAFRSAPSVDAAKQMVTDLGNLAMKDTTVLAMGAGAVIGGTAGVAAGAAKGGLEGISGGNPTKQAARVAEAGTKQAIAGIMEDAMKSAEQDMEAMEKSFVATQQARGVAPKDITPAGILAQRELAKNAPVLPGSKI